MGFAIAPSMLRLFRNINHGNDKVLLKCAFGELNFEFYLEGVMDFIRGIGAYVLLFAIWTPVLGILSTSSEYGINHPRLCVFFCCYHGFGVQ